MSKRFIRTIGLGMLAIATAVAVPAAVSAQPPGNVATPRLQWKHDTGVTALAISPDGTLVATAGYIVTYATATAPGYTEGEARLWNARSGELVRSFKVANDKIASLAFSPDSKLLAAGGGNVQLPHDAIRITVWDVASGRVVREVDGYEEDVTDLAFPGDEDGLVAVGYTRAAEDVTRLAVVPDGDGVIVRGSAQSAPPKVLRLWEGRDGDADWTLTWPITTRFGFGRNAAGDLLMAATSYVEGTWDRDIQRPGLAVVEVWNLRDKSKIAHGSYGQRPNMHFRSVSVSLTGNVVAAANAWNLEAWGVRGGLHFTTASDYPNELFREVAVSPDGSLLAVEVRTPRVGARQARTRVDVWELPYLPSGRIVARLFEGGAAPRSLTALLFTPDGSALVTADDDGNVQIWEVSRGPMRR